MTEIIISPFSNSALRDWPARHYADLVRLLLGRIDPTWSIAIIGTRGHRSAAAEIVRDTPIGRVTNLCGKLPWPDVLARLRGAACIVGNNSGIVHLGRQFGVPTVCVFGGSHQRTEWGPIGASSVILSRSISCSPCQFNHVWECPYDVACLNDIAAAEVVDAVMASLRTILLRHGANDVVVAENRIVASC